jgi:hypothetical protein
MEKMPFEFSEVILDNFDSFLDESFSEFQNGTDTATKTASGGGQSVDYGSLAQSTVSTAGNIVSIVQSSKAKKEASKSDMQRYVDEICGKDKSKSWIKKTRNTYNDCKKNAQKQFTSSKSQSDTSRKNKQADKQKKQQLAMKVAQEKAKEKQRNMYILIGVGVLLVAGYFYYQKNKQA